MDGRKFKRQRDQLGPTQREVLRMIYDLSGSWYWGCGRHWKNESHDMRVMRSLVKKGFAIERENAYRKWVFELTDAGIRQAEQTLPHQGATNGPR